jgi:hypothetical protein
MRSACALVLIAVAACYSGTPAPTFSASYDSVSADTLLAYIANDLQFDTRQWAGDSQRLMVGTCPGSCTYGQQGRIIARMINADTTPYPKYNIAGLDTVYWSVSRVVAASGDTSWGQTMYISTKGLRGTHPTPVVYDTALVEQHPHKYYPKDAHSIWVWSDSDETKWGTCGKDGCCR